MGCFGNLSFYESNLPSPVQAARSHATRIAAERFGRQFLMAVTVL